MERSYERVVELPPVDAEGWCTGCNHRPNARGDCLCVKAGLRHTSQVAALAEGDEAPTPLREAVGELIAERRRDVRPSAHFWLALDKLEAVYAALLTGASERGPVLAPSGHGTGVAIRTDLGSADQLLEAWQRFVAILEDPTARSLIGTAEAVDGLLARSNLQRAVEADAHLDLGELARSDNQYRDLAPRLLESTRIQLYGADQPVTDWWWRVAELAGEAMPGTLINVADAAAEKRVHPHTVRSAINSGELPARRLGRAFLIQRSDFARWQPRPVGRPVTGPRREADELLAAFNAANTRRNLGARK